jgi:hypothetical protein
MKNPLIIKAEAAVDSKVSSSDKEAYDKIVLAGMKVMFSKETHGQLVQGFNDAEDKLTTLVEGVIALIGILFQQSRGTMPPGPMVLAGQSLLMEALDFMEEAGMIEVDEQVLGDATQKYIETLLPKIGLTPDKMNAALAKAQGIMGDPQKIAEYKQSMEK